MVNEDIFLSNEEINYESATFPVPRELQETAHHNLRIGARDGHRYHQDQASTL